MYAMLWPTLLTGFIWQLMEAYFVIDFIVFPHGFGGHDISFLWRGLELCRRRFVLFRNGVPGFGEHDITERLAAI